MENASNTTEIVDIIKAMGWTINNVDVITSGATVLILVILLVVKLFSKCCGSTTPKCGCCATVRAGTTWQVISEILTPATTEKKSKTVPTDIIIPQDDPQSNDPRCNDPRCNDPRCNDPRCNDPRCNDPRCNDPRCNDSRCNQPSNEVKTDYGTV